MGHHKLLMVLEDRIDDSINQAIGKRLVNHGKVEQADRLVIRHQRRITSRWNRGRREFRDRQAQGNDLVLAEANETHQLLGIQFGQGGEWSPSRRRQNVDFPRLQLRSEFIVGTVYQVRFQFENSQEFRDVVTRCTAVRPNSIRLPAMSVSERIAELFATAKVNGESYIGNSACIERN